jgi:hypothetical protein
MVNELIKLGYLQKYTLAVRARDLLNSISLFYLIIGLKGY